ncbi:hypothetical protein HUS81_21360 [Pseudomonas chlororaphis]|nr:hypothetical protein [Pseudomonas chlororaphis]
MKVQDVCAVGNVEDCERVRFTETGSFFGNVVGSALAGTALTGSAATAICVSLGVPSMGAGALVCGLVVVGVGSFAGGALGSVAGEIGGRKIYEINQ